MFENCEQLSFLDVSYFNTENVLDMSDLFHRYKLLSSIDVSHFVTAKVTNMSGLFD